MHNSGCQLPEGPDYPLPVIRLSLINLLMQNVQCQFFFPLCNLDKLGELDEGDGVDAVFSVKQGDRLVHAVVSLTYFCPNSFTREWFEASAVADPN